MMTKNHLWKIRQQVDLCSIFYSDYETREHYDRKKICYFFDGYADYLQNKMNVDGLDGDNKFYDYVRRYDTADNLYNYSLICDDVEEVFRK